MTEWKHQDVLTNGIRLHVVTAGPQDGPMVLMLHGFPECWYGWHHQIAPLAARGYFVVVPDQRGYGRSDKPEAVADYRIDTIVADALGLADHFGRETFHVISHDWGGQVGWWLALDHADRVASFCVMNLPHPAEFARALRTTAQLRRSWYIFAFQVPGLAEWMLGRNDADRLTRALFANSVHKAFRPEDLEVYREAWRQPGAIRGMLAWYRAGFRYRSLRPRHGRVTVPTLILWGKQDKALGFEMVEPSAARCDRVQLEVIEDAGHFVQHDAHARVNGFLASFLPGR